LIPLTVPEVRRLLSLLSEPVAHHAFHLQWSWWRRVHQAVARRGHLLARARARPISDRPTPAVAPPRAAAVVPAWADLTETEWIRVQPLFAPRAPTGRIGRPARTVLAGILWVLRTNAAWHELPSEFGPWHTIYGRYRLWRQTGLWPRILQALHPTDPEVSL
jgi:Putative transposase of IS4/5 family (DUF4096)